jgi:signal transduction histidine kinase/CheY-like chemotaxis protein
MNPGKLDPSAIVLFRGISPADVGEIVSHGEWNNYDEGKCLIEKNNIPGTLYILIRGKVGVFNEDVLLLELQENAIFGEGFLADASATATIIATTPVTVLAFHRNVFFTLSEKYPRLILNIFSIYHQRLRNSNEKALKESREREARLKELVDERTSELQSALDELKSAHRELEITRDSLIETQKFRQQFLANMSHEIRTPMNAIVGLTNLLIKTPLSELQEKYLGVIRNSGNNLLVIINDILDLAKIESGKMDLEDVPFGLVNSIQNIHTILSLKANEKGIRLDADIHPEVPHYVSGDETRITQVIMNLAGNAIKFTEKGSVSISVNVEYRDGNEYALRFSIRDTGIGIPADKVDRIFESFGQASSDTTRKFGGTGLGLTISKQLVEMHGGNIMVESEVGKGSNFYFIIPYKVAEKPVADNGDSLMDAGIVAGKKVLLVEDNEFNQMVAVDTLKDIFPDLQVDVAESGEQAIEMLSANDYSFIFMDIQMPGMDGYETTRFIRNSTAADKKVIRICAMTANVTREEIDACYSSGMDDYMMKPFTPQELREKVIRNITR